MKLHFADRLLHRKRFWFAAPWGENAFYSPPTHHSYAGKQTTTQIESCFRPAIPPRALSPYILLFSVVRSGPKCSPTPETHKTNRVDDKTPKRRVERQDRGMQPSPLREANLIPYPTEDNSSLPCLGGLHISSRVRVSGGWKGVGQKGAKGSLVGAQLCSLNHSAGLSSYHYYHECLAEGGR